MRRKGTEEMTPKVQTQNEDQSAHDATSPATTAVATASLAATVKNIVTDKAQLEERTSKMIAELNEQLPALGYKIVSFAVDQTPLNGDVVVTAVKPKRGRPKGSVATAPRKMLKCNKCGARFSHPMHLGRHVTTQHGGKKK